MTVEQEYILKDLNIVYLPTNSNKAFDHALNAYPKYKDELAKIEQSGIETFGSKVFKCTGHVRIVKSLEDLHQFPILIKQTDQIEQEASLVLFGKAIESIEYTTVDNNKVSISAKETVLNKETAFGGVIDFQTNNPIKSISLHFKQNIIEDFVISCEYILNPKGIIDPNKVLLDQMKIKHSLSENLINIYYQPANQNVFSTTIELYIGDGRINGGKLLGVTNHQLIRTINLNRDNFMCSFSNITPGVYSYKVYQYDESMNLIISTEFIDLYVQTEREKRTIYIG